MPGGNIRSVIHAELLPQPCLQSVLFTKDLRCQYCQASDRSLAGYIQRSMTVCLRVPAYDTDLMNFHSLMRELRCSPKRVLPVDSSIAHIVQR